MRILLVSSFFPPEQSVAALRPFSWAKYWSESGHDVTVLTTEKREGVFAGEGYSFETLEVPYPNWVYRLKQLKQEFMEGSASKKEEGHTSPSWKTKLLSYLNAVRDRRGIFHSTRKPDFTDLWVKPALKRLDDLDPWDLIVSTAGPYTMHVLAHQIKKRGLAKKWIADYRDLWVDNHIFSGVFPFTMYEKYLERKLLSRADLVTTVSDPLAELLLQRYPDRNVKVLPNGYDPTELRSLSKRSIFPDDNKFRLVYTGSIYPGKRDPSPLFEAIKEIEKSARGSELLDRLEVLFLGSYLGDLDVLVKKYSVEKWVKNLGSVPRTQALQMQRDASLLLFLEWDDPSARGVFTGKVFEYLSASTPILAVGIDTENVAGQLMEQSGLGKVLGKDVEGIKCYIVECLEGNASKNLSCPEEILKKYQRKHLANEILEMIGSTYA